VRAAPDVPRWLAPHHPAPTGSTGETPADESTDTEGWQDLTLSFESLDDARSQLLGFGGAVEVLSPIALRRSMEDYARQILGRYERG